MKLVDSNPKTMDKTQALVDCSVRVIEDGQHYDYRIDASKDFVLKEDNSNRSQHPYIASYLSGIRKDFAEQILVLNKDGSERLGPIEVPKGAIPVFRLRTRNDRNGVYKFIIIGIVNKSSQTLHFLDIHGKSEVVTSPPDHGPTKKIDLMSEELARL